MRTVEQIVADLKKAEEEEVRAKALTLKYRTELEDIYTEVSKALGKKNPPGYNARAAEYYANNPPV